MEIDADDVANDDVPIAVDCVDAICDNGVSVFCEMKKEKKMINKFGPC